MDNSPELIGKLWHSQNIWTVQCTVVFSLVWTSGTPPKNPTKLIAGLLKPTFVDDTGALRPKSLLSERPKYFMCSWCIKAIDEEYLAFYDIGLNKGGSRHPTPNVCQTLTLSKLNLNSNFSTIKFHSPLSL